MNYIKKQRISILIIMCLGFSVLGVGIYMFTEIFSMIEKVNKLKTARDISRNIMIVNSTYYNLQADTFRYYFDPLENNLYHVENSTIDAGNVWNDFLFITKQNEGKMYDGAYKDIVSLADIVNRFMSSNKNCLDRFINKNKSNLSKADGEVVNCIKNIPQEELNDATNSFSERQAVFVDKKNKEVIDGFNNIGILMVFMMTSYVILLIVIINWIEHLNRWL